MLSYKKDKNGIFTITIVGNNDLKTLIEQVEKFRVTTTDEINVLMMFDLRKAKLNIAYEDIAKFNEYTINSTAAYENVRTAIVVDEPNITAVSYLFTLDTPHKHIKREVFSSPETALKWLKVHKKVL